MTNRTYDWLLTGALYEAGIRYFPNHSFQEFTAHIPSLTALNVRAIYLLPIMECRNKADYLILDHYQVNSEFGTEADLKELVRVAHQHGIKVLFDFVTSLTTDGSYILTEHPEWILRGDDGEMQHYFPFPEWGWALDCTNPEMIDYFAGVAAHYVKEFDIDGWRIDSPQNNYDPKKVSGDHTRSKIIAAAKKAVTAVKPEAVFVAETNGPTVMWSEQPEDAEPVFDEWCEAAYNYAFCGFMNGNPENGYRYANAEPFITPDWLSKPVTTLQNKIVHNQSSTEELLRFFQRQKVRHDSLRVHFTENHDTARVAQAFPQQQKAIFMLVAALPGVPVIHAGEQIGEKGKPGHSVQHIVVEWEKDEQGLRTYYQQVMEARAGSAALQRGTMHNVWAGGDNAIAFARVHGDEMAVAAMNFGPDPARIILDIRSPQGRESWTAVDAITGTHEDHKARELRHLELTLRPFEPRLLLFSAR